MVRIVKIAYEICMISLVILSLIYNWLGENGKIFLKVTWIIFLIDVSTRFILAKTKKDYVKKNTFDIISIIPLEDSLLLARFARLFRLFRMKTILKRYIGRISSYVERLGFKRITIISLGVVLLLIHVIYLLTDFTYFKSYYWVIRNFTSFNAMGETIRVPIILIAIVVKIIGVIYSGYVIGIGIQYARKKLKIMERGKEKEYERKGRNYKRTGGSD